MFLLAGFNMVAALETMTNTSKTSNEPQGKFLTNDNGLPDLVINYVDFKINRLTKSFSSITIEIENINKDATVPRGIEIPVFLCFDEEDLMDNFWITYISSGYLENGEQKLAVKELFFLSDGPYLPGGKHRIRAVMDPYGEVEEPKDNNVCYSDYFGVKAKNINIRNNPYLAFLERFPILARLIDLL
jgi:hypothetical protein